MNEVIRNNDPSIGPLDGVSLEAKCAITSFTTAKGKVVGTKSQEMADCNIKASMELGVISISVPGKARMVTIRIDEAMAVLKEAADAANELAAGRKEGEENV